MRRMLLSASAAAILIFALSACTKKAEQVAENTASDSLLSSNPVEQPAGNIAPQTDYQAPPDNQSQTSSATTSKHTTAHPASSTPSSSVSHKHEAPAETGTLVAAGTPISISVSTPITSETANAGDTWSGEVKEAVIVGDKVVIPAGSTVEGVIVTSVGSSRVDLQACKLEYSIVSPK